MRDTIVVGDNLKIGTQLIADPEIGIRVKGKVRIEARERGKLIYEKDSNNIFTITGREWVTQLMGYSNYAPLTPARNDRIRYIGVGSGVKPQVATVDSLATPVTVDGTNFLTQVNIGTYPLSPAKTERMYAKLFDTNEISTAGTVTIQEAGLYTDGASPNYAPGSIDLTMASASTNTPIAYFSFDPIPKTQSITLAIEWTLVIG
jgi:hypothetical protein